MDDKNMRRIRRENIKRLEASLLPLEIKVSRAELEHQFCPHVNKNTGVCDFPEERALQIVKEFSKEHRTSSLIGGNSAKDTGNWKGGGDQKKSRVNNKKQPPNKNDGQSADEAANQARENLLSEFKAEKDRLEMEIIELEKLNEGIPKLISDLDGFMMDEEDSEE